MLETNAELYLPITETSVKDIIVDSDSIFKRVEHLSVPEVASLLLLGNMAKIQRYIPQQCEHLLAETIAACQLQIKTDGVSQFSQDSATLLSSTLIQQGYRLLPKHKIAFLDEETIKRQWFLTQDGHWDYAFTEKHQIVLSERLLKYNDGLNLISLTTEQSRLAQEFINQNDEHMHFSGYAGTGKTSLIRFFISELQKTSAQILILAQTKKQLKALEIDSNTMPHVHQKTFGDIVGEIITRDLTSSASMNMLKRDYGVATTPDTQIIQQLGIIDNGLFQAHQIVQAVRETLTKFCFSCDDEIDECHIPKRYKYYDQTNKYLICHYTSELWKLYLLPATREFKLKIREMHAVKWAALNRCVVPSKYTHIVIDESHNLSQAVLQILENSQQTRISLGDDYQNLNGYVTKLPNNLRQRQMNHSVRSNCQIDPLINTMLAAHPRKKMSAQFIGNQMSSFDLTVYEKSRIPEHPTAIIAKDHWSLFEWSQRLAIHNITVNFMSNLDRLNVFVQDCIELFSSDTKARHPELFRFSSWNDVYKQYQHNDSFQNIHTLLEKKYSYKDWERTFNHLKNNNDYAHSLALVENVRNLEFDNVMLTSDFFSEAAGQKNAILFNAIYTSATRSTKRLAIPSTSNDWLDSLSS